MHPAIKVEDLGKQYQIGARVEPYETLRDAFGRTLRAPFREVVRAKCL